MMANVRQEKRLISYDSRILDDWNHDLHDKPFVFSFFSSGVLCSCPNGLRFLRMLPIFDYVVNCLSNLGARISGIFDSPHVCAFDCLEDKTIRNSVNVDVLPLFSFSIFFSYAKYFPCFCVVGARLYQSMAGPQGLLFLLAVYLILGGVDANVPVL